jgi:Family of unknown function (DUF6516)
MAAIDHELEFLLSLDGTEFRLLSGLTIKIDAHTVAATGSRPHGVKYSLTLHDASGQRIYGMDNAHGIARRPEYDHRHLYGRGRMVGYAYRGPAELLADFYREVERIITERSTQ